MESLCSIENMNIDSNDAFSYDTFHNSQPNVSRIIIQKIVRNRLPKNTYSGDEGKYFEINLQNNI